MTPFTVDYRYLKIKKSTSPYRSKYNKGLLLKLSDSTSTGGPVVNTMGEEEDMGEEVPGFIPGRTSYPRVINFVALLLIVQGIP